MNTIKFQALGYLGIGVSLIKLSLPASGWRESFLLTVGIVFMLVCATVFLFPEVKLTTVDKSHRADTANTRESSFGSFNVTALGSSLDTKAGNYSHNSGAMQRLYMFRFGCWQRISRSFALAVE